VLAGHDGVVAGLAVGVGDTVAAGAVICEIEPDGAPREMTGA
jgi:pyruvate/2-oxoglutarate dehydrogenase complex dihydrolipoamide acyltransferase (E2) component